MDLGADVVGGIPWIEFTEEEELDHVNSMCNYAKEYDKDISMLLDDVGDAEERTLEMLCKKVIEMGWQGKSNRTALPCHGAVSGELLQKARFPLKESPDWCGIRSAYRSAACKSQRSSEGRRAGCSWTG